MEKLVFILVSLVCVLLPSINALFDPVSIGLAAGAALGLYKFETVKDQTYCRFSECCNSRYILDDMSELRVRLKNSLFGQHIVMQQLLPALDAHFSGRRNSRKPLVISFHGTPGTGKNFVADHIASSIYTEGLQSKFVHKYMGRADFPVEAKASEYSARISKDVRQGIAACPRSLFIFDEVEKMPPLVFESLTSLLNYNTFVDGQDNTQAIFIFLSNTAGVHISDTLGKLLKGGTLREDTRLSHFEPILEKAAYNLDGGLKKTSLIESHVIDHFIPFLPLEKSHIRKCLISEFKRWHYSPTDKQLDEIIKESITYDRVYGIFATSGCKKLDKKVAVEANSF